MRLDIVTLAIRLIHLLRPLAAKIRKHDRALHDQLKRAGSSVPLNIAESLRFRDGNRRQRLSTAAGTADETWIILDVAAGWGYIDESETKEVVEVIDRIQAMIHKMQRK